MTLRSLTLILAALIAAPTQAQAVPTTYPIGGVGTFSLTVIPSSAIQPAGYNPVWNASDPCVTLVVASDGMSAQFMISNQTSCVGKSVTVAATTPPYPGMSTGASGNLTFTISSPTTPTGFVMTRTK